jgi:hypothetical protein
MFQFLLEKFTESFESLPFWSQVFVFLILAISVIISLVFLLITPKWNSAKITSISVLAVSFVLLFLLFFTIISNINWDKTRFFGNGYYSTDPETVSVICPGLGTVTGEIKYFGDKPYYFNMIQYLTKTNGEVFLLGEYGSRLGGDNSKIYNKYQNKNSSLGLFPVTNSSNPEVNYSKYPKNPFLGQTYKLQEVTVKEAESLVLRGNYTDGSTSSMAGVSEKDLDNARPATYIYPDKMTEKEFYTLTNCLKLAQKKQLQSVKEYKFKHQKLEAYMYNPRIFVYHKPKNLPKRYEKSYPNSKGKIALHRFVCKNSGYTEYQLYIYPDRKVEMVNSQKYQINLIGKLNSEEQIARETDYKLAVSDGFTENRTKTIMGINYNSKYHKSVTDASFDEAYKNSKATRFLFQKTGEVNNKQIDYCYDEDDKTLWDYTKVYTFDKSLNADFQNDDSN